MSRVHVQLNRGRYDGVGYVIQPNGCWEWEGTISPSGYGRITNLGDKNRTQYAHRWMYERERGPIAPGYELDHLCRNRRCVNPAHLEPVTHQANCLRGARALGLTPALVAEIRKQYRAGLSTRTLATAYGMSASAIGAITHGYPRDPLPPRSHCDRGHPFTGGNLKLDKFGVRRCRQCRRDAHNAWMRAARSRRRVERSAIRPTAAGPA